MSRYHQVPRGAGGVQPADANPDDSQHSDAELHLHTDALRYADAHEHTNEPAATKCNADCNPNTHGNGHPDADADRNPNPDAEPDITIHANIDTDDAGLHR